VRAATLMLTLLLACGREDMPGSDGSDTAAPATTEPTGTAGADPPSGRSCPLVGLFVDCEQGGQTYCDDIDGALRFGPCLDEVACDIAGGLSCDGYCDLIDGVPTYIVKDDCGGDSGNNETDSA
jgi:hypothetical protein